MNAIEPRTTEREKHSNVDDDDLEQGISISDYQRSSFLPTHSLVLLSTNFFHRFFSMKLSKTLIRLGVCGISLITPSYRRTNEIYHKQPTSWINPSQPPVKRKRRIKIERVGIKKVQGITTRKTGERGKKSTRERQLDGYGSRRM